MTGDNPLPGVDPISWRVLAWNPPRLLLGQGDEVRAFFVAASSQEIWIGAQGAVQTIARRRREHMEEHALGGNEELTSPMPGKVLALLVKEGEQVKTGQRLLIVEAMKMENPIRAPHDAKVKTIHVKVGDSVQAGQALLELTDPT